MRTVIAEVSAAVVAVAIAGTTAGCGAPQSAVATLGAPPVQAAVDWVAGFVTAGQTSPSALAPYLAADVQLDHRTIDSGLATGRSDYLRCHQTWGYLDPSVRTEPELYLDERGAVIRQQVGGLDLLVLLEVGPDGLSLRRDLVSVRSARAAGWTVEVPAAALLGMDADATAFVFQENRRVAPVTEVWVPAEVGGCPGVRAVMLDEAGAVTGRRSLVEAASLPQCRRPGSGWWIGLQQPARLSERPTGRARTESGAIEIRNGSPVLQRLVQVELDRFAAAGLTTPVASAIAFDPYDARCQGVEGWFDFGSRLVLVCFEEESLCSQGQCVPSTDQRRVLLHELSHAWVEGHVTEADRALFMRHVGVQRWNDPDDLWRERGTEWAAEAIAWGLRGDRETPPCLSRPSCDLLATGFEILTGQPVGTACPAGPSAR